MDVGSGITLGTAILTGGAVVIKWMSAPQKPDDKAKNILECAAHSGIVTMLAVLKQGQEEIRADVKELLSRGM
jgi:hypothetical protein